MLANTQGQGLLVAGVSHNEAFGNALEVRKHEEIMRRATVADPDNGVALRLPPLKFPWNIQSAAASGYYNEKVSNEVGAGTILLAASKSSVYIAESNKAQRKRRVHQTGNNPLDAELKCFECNKSFNSKKDLNRHLRTTKVHNGRVVARCSCGKTVTRKDALASHRRYCRGTTEELEPEA